MPETSFALSVIIVNWNTGQLLSDCLMALFNEIENLKSQIIVVDNHSSDDSIPLAKQLFPSVNYLENSFNGGFAKANNQGLKWATGKYILFLNPDTKVQKDSIHRLIHFLDENPRTGIVGGKLIYPDGKPQHSYFKFPTVFALKQFVALHYLNPNYFPQPGDEKEVLWVKRLVRWGYLDYIPREKLIDSTNLNSTIPFEIDYPVGACFLIRGEMVKQIGMFDERFFLYCEETDFCLRAKQKGWEIHSVPAAIIVHYAGASTGKTGDKRFKIWSKSQYLYIRKHYGWIPALKLKFLLNRFKKVYAEMINSISVGDTSATTSKISGGLK